MLHKLSADFHAFYPDMIKLRREFHMYPELSLEEIWTPKKIESFLISLGLDVQTGEKKGKTIALRADFDGLPIQDEKDVSYKSKDDGAMHACGHDIHTAALLGITKVLPGI